MTTMNSATSRRGCSTILRTILWIAFWLLVLAGVSCFALVSPTWNPTEQWGDGKLEVFEEWGPMLASPTPEVASTFGSYPTAVPPVASTQVPTAAPTAVATATADASVAANRVELWNLLTGWRDASNRSDFTDWSRAIELSDNDPAKQHSPEGTVFSSAGVAYCTLTPLEAPFPQGWVPTEVHEGKSGHYWVQANSVVPQGVACGFLPMSVFPVQ